MITRTAIPFLIRLAFPLTESACNRICDSLIPLLNAESDYRDNSQLNPRDLDLIMTFARFYDSSESFHAAHIRDTIRDNCEYDPE